LHCFLQRVRLLMQCGCWWCVAVCVVCVDIVLQCVLQCMLQCVLHCVFLLIECVC